MKREMKETDNLIGRRGLMLVLSSPSGAGKTTLANALAKKIKAIGYKVGKCVLYTRSVRLCGCNSRTWAGVSFKLLDLVCKQGFWTYPNTAGVW